MKKSDLVSGKHIVELREGSRLLVAGDFLPDIDGNGFMCLTSYSDDLRLNDCEVDYDESHADFDICKVYEIVKHMGLPILANNMDTACKIVWERKPELSEVERVILENVDKQYKWIARDSSKKIYLYKEKPIRSHGVWLSGLDQSVGMHQFGDLFKMIDSESWNPILIADLLDKDEPFRWPE